MSAGIWQEAKTSEGKVYFWNTVTKATQWTKPEETDSSVCYRYILAQGD